MLSFVVSAGVLLALAVEAAPPPSQKALVWQGGNLGIGSIEVLNAGTQQRVGCLEARGLYTVAPVIGLCPEVFAAGSNRQDGGGEYAFTNFVIKSLSTGMFCGWKRRPVNVVAPGSENTGPGRKAWYCDRPYEDAEWLLNPSADADLLEFGNQLRFQNEVLERYPLQIRTQPPRTSADEVRLLWPVPAVAPDISQAYALRWVPQGQLLKKVVNNGKDHIRDAGNDLRNIEWLGNLKKFFPHQRK